MSKHTSKNNLPHDEFKYKNLRITATKDIFYGIHIDHELILGISLEYGYYCYISALDDFLTKKAYLTFSKAIPADGIQFDKSYKTPYMLFGIIDNNLHIYNIHDDVLNEMFVIDLNTQKITITK